MPAESAQDVKACCRELRQKGWEATVYGRPTAELVDELLDLSRQSLGSEERKVLATIAELWEARMVPRDAFVMQEIRQSRGW